MQEQTHDIAEWESIEVLRSASEAQTREGTGLKIRQDIIDRYSAPRANTPYPLEYAYHLLGDVSGKTVLDYGCGSGENSVLAVDHGAKVIGIDISPDLIALARKRSELHSVEQNVEFRVGSAHELPLDDQSVDVVFGKAILHHLDLKLSSREVFRVLRKGGKAIFLEPVRNSKFIRFVRGLIPYTAPDVSPYERPLTDIELAEFAEPFTTYDSRAFSLPVVNLLQVLRVPDRLFHKAIRLDGWFLQNAPALDHFASVRVIQLTK